MSVRCNICSIEIEEIEVESHIVTQKHLENKSKVSTNSKGVGKSVASMWLKSFT
ncbi:MAG TPA: hypothetical protein VFW99_01060 [Candidatus Nitrosotalea sp.]|nr:hypothetical protein [Candidatus Nitrosotalea sp.]